MMGNNLDGAEEFSRRELSGDWLLLYHDIGACGLRAVFNRVGGGKRYIPTVEILDRLQRDRDMYDYFTGNNYSEVAGFFNVSSNTVRRAIARERVRRGRH